MSGCIQAHAGALLQGSPNQADSAFGDEMGISRDGDIENPIYGTTWGIIREIIHKSLFGGLDFGAVSGFSEIHT
jgi:hypothetical protein